MLCSFRGGIRILQPWKRRVPLRDLADGCSARLRRLRTVHAFHELMQQLNPCGVCDAVWCVMDHYFKQPALHAGGPVLRVR